MTSSPPALPVEETVEVLCVGAVPRGLADTRGEEAVFLSEVVRLRRESGLPLVFAVVTGKNPLHCISALLTATVTTVGRRIPRTMLDSMPPPEPSNFVGLPPDPEGLITRNHLTITLTPRAYILSVLAPTPVRVQGADGAAVAVNGSGGSLSLPNPATIIVQGIHLDFAIFTIGKR
jgi:hypothetical protein